MAWNGAPARPPAGSDESQTDADDGVRRRDERGSEKFSSDYVPDNKGS